MASVSLNKSAANAGAAKAAVNQPAPQPPATPAAKPQGTPAAKPLQEKPVNPPGGIPFGNVAARYTAKPSTATDKPFGGTPGGPGFVSRAAVSPDKGADAFTPSNRLFLGGNTPGGGNLSLNCNRPGGPGGTPSNGAGTPAATPVGGSTPASTPSGGNTPIAATTPSGAPPVGAVPGTTPGGTTQSAGTVKVFGGSQSGENNIELVNGGSGDMLIYAKKNLAKGEADPGGTVIRIPQGQKITVSALDGVGLSYQVYSGQLTPEQQTQLAQGGVVTGVAAPPKQDVLYETNYVPGSHQSFDDISPLDGAKTPIKVAGNGGRTVSLTQAILDGAPIHNPDGSVPGLGPSASPNNNNAQLPALRDYYMRMSLMPDGTRAFYYNSSDSGGADTANVSYFGSTGSIRTTITFG